jgi:hypothetical protein
MTEKSGSVHAGVMLSLGTVDKSFADYKLYQAPVRFMGKDTRYKAIIKDSQLAAIVGKTYKLLPNEVVVEVAKEMADKVGAVPFKEKENVIYNKRSSRVFVSYILQDKEDIIGNDKVHPGFTLQNSIDATLAFSCSGFTYRTVCENGVMVGFRRLSAFYRKHTSGLEIEKDKIEKMVENTLKDTEQVLKAYAIMAQEKLTEEIAKNIAKLSRPLRPEYITVKKGELVEFDQTKTLWDVYNDITAAIWHNAKFDIDGKVGRFDLLHKLIPLPRV